MSKLPAHARAFARDNAVLLASLAAAVVVNGVLLWGFQGSMKQGAVVLVVPVDAVAAPGVKAPVAPPAAEPPQQLPQQPKPPEGQKPPPPPKPAEKKPEPKRAVTEKKPEAAKPPQKANPGEADLAPLRMEVPEPLTVDMAQLLRIEVENRGRAPSGPHHDALYFSLSDKLDDKAVPLGVIQAGDALAPGEKRWERAQVLLPDKTPSGRAYLIVVLNADGAMPETNHANNQLVVPVMVDAESVPLGDPNERPRTTVAWISSKDFRELKARQSRTLQPAVQNEAVAQADAKLHNQPGISEPKPALGEVKPKPDEKKVAEKPVEQAPKVAPTVQHKDGGPVADAKPAPKAEVPKPQPPKVAEKPAEKPEKKPVEKPAPQNPAVATPKPAPKDPFVPKPEGQGSPQAPKVADAKPPEKPPEKVAEKPPEKTPDPATPPVADAAKPDTAKVAGAPGLLDGAPKPQEPKKTAAASTGEGATSTPLDTSSAPATQLDESSLEQQPGRVLVGKGVKINTARIQQPGPSALIEGVSSNPRVAVTFNANGEVIKAEIIRSSGNIGWDHQVQLAMQRWTAEGEEVKKGGLVIRWTVLLGAGD